MEDLFSDESDEEEKHRDDDLLEDIISDVKRCEKEQAGQQSQLLSWMKNQPINSTIKHKDFLKNELKNLRKQLKQILESSKIINKPEQAHELLANTLRTIKEKDDNLCSTPAFQLCATKIKSIETEYPDLRRSSPIKGF